MTAGSFAGTGKTIGVARRTAVTGLPPEAVQHGEIAHSGAAVPVRVTVVRPARRDGRTIVRRDAALARAAGTTAVRRDPEEAGLQDAVVLRAEAGAARPLRAVAGRPFVVLELAGGKRREWLATRPSESCRSGCTKCRLSSGVWLR
jgi:hypothetical protein